MARTNRRLMRCAPNHSLTSVVTMPIFAQRIITAAAFTLLGAQAIAGAALDMSVFH